MYNIEEELFISYKYDVKKLKKYGFKEEKDSLVYEKNIMDDSFKVKAIISKDKKLSVKVFDIAFGDEYTNFRMEENQGEFVARVRENIQSILLDIRDNCYQKEQFEFDQTLRIVNLIKEKYGDVPDFEWMDDPTCGAIKHKDTLKWYGLIMGIDYSKLEENKKGYIEVINLKIDDKKIPDLVHENGIYPAYHMNKKYWITVTMDDKQEDSSIMKLIDESYQFAANGKKVRKGTTNEWIVPANPKYYDLIKEFKGKKEAIWKQSSNIKVGDMIYLYVAAPYSSIMYKCEVIETGIPYEKKAHSNIKELIRVKLLENYEKGKYPFKLLNDYGVMAVRNSRFMPEELSKYINSKEKENKDGRK